MRSEDLPDFLGGTDTAYCKALGGTLEHEPGPWVAAMAQRKAAAEGALTEAAAAASATALRLSKAPPREMEETAAIPVPVQFNTTIAAKLEPCLVERAVISSQWGTKLRPSGQFKKKWDAAVAAEKEAAREAELAALAAGRAAGRLMVPNLVEAVRVVSAEAAAGGQSAEVMGRVRVKVKVRIRLVEGGHRESEGAKCLHVAV